MNSKTFSKPVLGVFAALAVVGVACWIYQLMSGLAVTGMSNANSWGLYICTFMLFVGLSAGGLLVPFLILAVAKNREKRGMVILASALVVLGVACKRVWLLFTSFIHPNIYGGAGITTGAQAAQADPSAMWTTLGFYAPRFPKSSSSSAS